MKYTKRIRFFALMFVFIIGALAGLYSDGFKTLRQRKIISNLEGFYIIEGYNSDIYYPRGLYEYAQTVNRIVDCYYTALKNDFSVAKPGRIKFIIYANSHDLYNAIDIDYGDKPPMGVYYAGLIHILSPDNWAGASESEITEAFVEEGPVIHEMSHYMLDKKTKGNFVQWFSEGIALYYEHKYTGFEWRKDIINQGDYLSFKEMDKYFKTTDEAIAYKAAYEKVNEIALLFSEEALKGIYEYLENGNSLSSAIAFLELE